jgi:formate hydrogenlyase subunit 6/NADH:ubiquinone oxidoreductase subunit I
VGDIRIPHFELPTPSDIGWNLPWFIIKRALKNALTSKPVVDEGKCLFCNQCVEICPPKVLEKKEKGLVFDYGKCIRCFCCQEVCPEGAIIIKPGWALKLVSRK